MLQRVASCEAVRCRAVAFTSAAFVTVRLLAERHEECRTASGTRSKSRDAAVWREPRRLRFVRCQVGLDLWPAKFPSRQRASGSGGAFFSRSRLLRLDGCHREFFGGSLPQVEP